MREVFQHAHHEAGFLDLCTAFRALADVGPQGIHPKAHLVIEEEVDLVWKQVPVIHEVSGKAYGAV
jgi:hypothetical protein